MRHAFLPVILCLTSLLSAQLNGKYPFHHIDQTDGLLHTTVKGIGQDAKGFIWILTWNGLQRYDGSRFVNYPEVINHSSFGVMHDTELYVDTAKNHIWIRKGNISERMDLSSHKIETMKLLDVMNSDSSHQPILFESEGRQSWLINENGAITYDMNTTKTRGAFFNVNPFQPHRSTFIIKDPNSGDFWLHNFKHLLIADHLTKRIHASSDQIIDHPLLKHLWRKYGNENKIRYIMFDSDHNIWISTWTKYLHRYNIDTEEFFTYSLQDVKARQPQTEKGDFTLLVNALYEDRQKKIWIATDYTGLLRYNKEEDNFDFITSDEKITNGLRYNYSIFSIFQDRDDNIWLGTDGGISIFNPYRNQFQSIRHIDGKEASLPKQNIHDVVETGQGELYVATWGGGISVFDKEWNFIRNMKFNGPVEHYLVWCMVQLDDGKIWAGTQAGYIHIYDPDTKSIKTIRPDEVEHSTILIMRKDQDGNIILGLQDGRVIFWNKAENKFHKYHDTEFRPREPYLGIINIYIDVSNRYWITTASGLQEFNREKGISSVVYRPENIDTIQGITIKGMLSYNDSTLLVGTIYHGIYFFNTRTKTFSRPATDHQLNNTSIYAIRRDVKGDIWLSLDYSLIKMSPDLVYDTRFHLDRSIVNSAFSGNTFYELSDGRWVVSTQAELVCFDPLSIGVDHVDREVVEICGFNVLGIPMYIDSLLEKRMPVILEYDQNFFSIEFSVLDYTDIRQANYYYRLSGVDKNWMKTSSKNFADYTDIKPGDYVFEVKADHGGSTSQVTSFSLSILPPWWGTIWFRSLVLLCFLAMVYYIWKRRIYAVRKAADLKHQIAETEMMALRSQMNPHFIFNCINSIDAMIQSNDKYRATVYLNKFARLIRNVLDNSKQNSVLLSKDMETLQLYVDLERFRHQNKFSVTIHVDDELMQGDYKVPPLIVQPYVENAILHGLRHSSIQDAKLHISVTKEEPYLVYIIEDNGVGRLQKNGNGNKSDKPHGMQMSNDRVRLFNEEELASVQISDLQIDGKPSGTRIRVQLKIQ